MSDVSTKQRTVVAYEIDYSTLREIVRSCGGWFRGSGGPEGDTIEVWHDDTRLTFKDRALVRFLEAVKDHHMDLLYATKDLLDYIEQAAKQPPSVFVRDAIVGRARELKAKIETT